jgi:hypothetical protein
MMRRNRVVFLGLRMITGAFLGGITLEGCGSSSTPSSSANAGEAGEAGAPSGRSGEAGAPTSNAGSSDAGAGGSTEAAAAGSSDAGAAGSAAGPGNELADATVQDITTGKVAAGTRVKIAGAVAMSHQFLIAKGGAGTCLWGLFISAPGLTETAANSGILVTDYGAPPTVTNTSSFCPAPGVDPIGDHLPDAVSPGDVLDIEGLTAYTEAPLSCAAGSVGHYQLNQGQSAGITSASGPVPTPHVLSAPELTQLVSVTDTAFHDQWGGVKVRLQSVTSVPQSGSSITDAGGNIVLLGSNLEVSDKLYYQGLLMQTDNCHAGPVYANDMTTFTQIDGFSFFDGCAWNLAPANRCLDFEPASDDCAAKTCP